MSSKKLPSIRPGGQAVDRLPQPFRMLDKLLSEIVAGALLQCVSREQAREWDAAIKIQQVCCRLLPAKAPCTQAIEPTS